MFILAGILPRNLGINLLLQLFATLDRIAYTVFGWIIQGVFDIANADIINASVYESFEQRIYVLLGIFMLFKITVSMLGYLVNPDKIADKEKGLSKMVTRTIAVLCMLVGLPFVFNLMDRVQPYLLEALPRIVIGKSTNEDEVSGQMTSVADAISWQLFKLSLSADTVAIMESENINTVEGATSVITEPETGNNSAYKYFYFPVVGMVIAIVMSVILVGIAIDVAIRAFKLVILRMIAPIPVISYIDPKSAKDGAFASWTKLLISTWLDLFIKLGVLYLVLFFLDTVILQGGLNLTDNIGFFRNSIVIAFIIIGLIFFAKQAPKFISKALGIKEGGGMGVGLGGVLAGAGALVGGAGLAGALAASTQAMNENADAAAQGKAGTAGWSKGSDLAAQLRTGDSKAKGGLMNKFASRLNERAQIDAGNRRASNLGLTAGNVKSLKNEMFAREDDYKKAQDAFSEYQTGVQSGMYEYDPEVARNLQQNVRAASQRYSDTKDAYDKAKSARETLIPKDSAVDNYSKKPTYQAIKSNGGRGNYTKGVTTTKELESKIASNAQKSPEKYVTYEDDDVTPRLSKKQSADSGPSDEEILHMMADAQNAANDNNANNNNSNN